MAVSTVKPESINILTVRLKYKGATFSSRNLSVYDATT